MSPGPAQSRSALWTFAIFALAGPAIGAVVLLIPNIPAFARWVAVDPRVLLSLIDAALLIYPLGIWPGLIAGAAVAWRDRAGGATLPFSVLVSLAAGIVWLAAFEYLLLPAPHSPLSEINLLRLCACVFAGAFCWWLSRPSSQQA